MDMIQIIIIIPMTTHMTINTNTHTCILNTTYNYNTMNAQMNNMKPTTIPETNLNQKNANVTQTTTHKSSIGLYCYISFYYY